MNRYKSSQKWRKVGAGIYESPDNRFIASLRGDKWHLRRQHYGGEKPLGTFLTLADCQEHAERLERRDASV